MILLLYADCWYHVVAIWSTCCHVGLPFCLPATGTAWLSCCSSAATWGLPFCSLMLLLGFHVVHLLTRLVAIFFICCDVVAILLPCCSPAAPLGCHLFTCFHVVVMLFTCCTILLAVFHLLPRDCHGVHLLPHGVAILFISYGTTWFTCCLPVATWGCHFCLQLPVPLGCPVVHQLPRGVAILFTSATCFSCCSRGVAKFHLLPLNLPCCSSAATWFPCC